MEKRVDYASKLPEPLLHHILSFLKIKQIVQTSLLSKTWYQAWNTFQILEFDFFDIFSQDLDRYKPVESTPDINRQRLYRFIDRILLTRRRQGISLHKFTLMMPWIYQRPHTVAAIDQWIACALESRVKQLKVVVGPYSDDEKLKYSVPRSVFDSSWLQVLYLYDCKLKLPFSGNVKLSCLKQLTFRTVYVDDNFIGNLLAGSPLLEDLSLITVFGIKELKVGNLAKLRKINIQWLPDLEKLALHAPNLEAISLETGKDKWPHSVNLGVSCKKLSITRSPIADKWLNEQLSRLPHLENLELFLCPNLETIKISNPLVSGLSICCCEKLTSVQIDAPCLRDFRYYGDVVSILSPKNRSTLSKVSFDFDSKNMDITWYARLIELLANFNTSFDVFKYVFTSNTGKWVVIPEEVRQMAVPPLTDAKDLNLKIWSKKQAFPMAQLEEAMSWIAPHPHSLSIYIYP